MNPTARTSVWTVAIGLILLALIFSLTVIAARLNPQGAQARNLPVYGTVADFALTNQMGAAVSRSDLQGRVWIADIIFTRCPGPCLRMTRQMKELEQALPARSRIKLVSLTTDPDFDTPPVLTTYAQRFSVDTNRWTFLTGTKKQIGDLAVGSLKLAAVEKSPEERASADDLFVHSTMFVLVDKQGQLRGVYETGGEGVDWTESKQKILDAAKALEREP